MFTVGKLLKIQDSKVEEIFSANEEFYWINSLIVIENKAYVSMDKMVAVIDIEADKIEYFTNISEEAEIDIMIVQNIGGKL